MAEESTRKMNAEDIARTRVEAHRQVKRFIKARDEASEAQHLADSLHFVADAAERELEREKP